MTALRQQMIDAMVLRGLSAKTQEAYLRVVTRLAAFYGRSPDRISEREIQTYLLHLYREKGFRHSTCNVAVAGLRFFYPVTLRRRSTGFVIPAAREPRRLPEILSREELTRLFSHTVRPKHRTLLLTAYAAGWRGAYPVACGLRCTQADYGGGGWRAHPRMPRDGPARCFGTRKQSVEPQATGPQPLTDTGERARAGHHAHGSRADDLRRHDAVGWRRHDLLRLEEVPGLRSDRLDA